MRLYGLLFQLLLAGLITQSVQAYQPGRDVEGTLLSEVWATVTCMNLRSRNLFEVTDKIAPGNAMNVVGNVEKFVILSVNLPTSVFRHTTVSIQSDDVDRLHQGICRVDIKYDDFVRVTRLTGLRR